MGACVLELTTPNPLPRLWDVRSGAFYLADVGEPDYPEVDWRAAAFFARVS